jgi:DNA-binding CsgD family transcriptional regulator
MCGRAPGSYGVVVGDDRRERAAAKIVKIAGAATDLASLWRASTDVLGGVVRHYWTPCWYTLDPASLLITSHYQYGLPEFPASWLADEYYGEDVNQLAEIAVSDTGISTLHEATGGHPDRSPRWHRNMTLGGDQELVARLRTRTGEVWGMLGLYREPGSPMFDAADKAFLRHVAPYLAEGARRALLLGEAIDPEGPEAPGLVILTKDWEIASMTPGTQRWLAELPDGGDQLPAAVMSVAGRALRQADHPEWTGQVAVARALSRRGSWIVLHGACLEEPGDRRVAVIIEAAHPARIYPLLMAAYKLSERERDVTRLVLLGSSTAQIAASLSVSAHTVQQHLKSVFDKTGVHSRRDLIGKVFFQHYEPRFRDNEHRAAASLPMRGGPARSREPLIPTE